VSWRARSRQIRDHHRAQRRGSSRRYKRRLTSLQEGVSWFYSLLCSAPLRALDVVTEEGPGLSEIAFIHALLRQSMTRSAHRYHGPYLVVAQYCNEQTIIGFAPIYDGHAQTCRSGSPCRSSSRSTANHACEVPASLNTRGPARDLCPRECCREARRACQYGIEPSKMAHCARPRGRDCLFGTLRGHVHGFLYRGATFTTFDDPLGTGGNFAFGISDVGPDRRGVRRSPWRAELSVRP
jgi:hypothetical protein